MSNENYGFWLFAGKNGLQGAASTYRTEPDGRVVTIKDPDNPAVLEDLFIADILRTSRQARHDFCRLFPTLGYDEQERLSNLILNNPRQTSLLRDSMGWEDALQHQQVAEDVRTRLASMTRRSQIAAQEKVRS